MVFGAVLTGQLQLQQPEPRFIFVGDHSRLKRRGPEMQQPDIQFSGNLNCKIKSVFGNLNQLAGHKLLSLLTK
ncbi:hypothetical protein D3C71_1970340 [compost metagenome]